MKKLFILLFFTISSFGQIKDAPDSYQYVSVGFELRSTFDGSAYTQHNQALNIILHAGLVGNDIEVYVGYEHFPAIEYGKFIFGGGYHFPMYWHLFGETRKTTFIPSIDIYDIIRWGDEWETNSSHIALGGNLALRWKLAEHFHVEYQLNFTGREDLQAKYPTLHKTTPIEYNNYFKLIYEF